MYDVAFILLTHSLKLPTWWYFRTLHRDVKSPQDPGKWLLEGLGIVRGSSLEGETNNDKGIGVTTPGGGGHSGLNRYPLPNGRAERKR